jgi:hypothetical protein
MTIIATVGGGWWMLLVFATTTTTPFVIPPSHDDDDDERLDAAATTGSADATSKDGKDNKTRRKTDQNPHCSINVPSSIIPSSTFSFFRGEV